VTGIRQSMNLLDEGAVPVEENGSVHKASPFDICPRSLLGRRIVRPEERPGIVSA
jgi:hypothetical protein